MIATSDVAGRCTPMTIEYATLAVRRDGPVEWLTLNRPEQLNALTGQMVDELLHYFDRLQFDHGTRVVGNRPSAHAPDLDLHPPNGAAARRP
jgi:1,4-dihydroxy-2-naphthoyl-CoA synthase